MGLACGFEVLNSIGVALKKLVFDLLDLLSGH
jgi:hypothetical protein